MPNDVKKKLRGRTQRERAKRAKGGKRQSEEEVRGDGRRMRTVKSQVQKHRHRFNRILGQRGWRGVLVQMLLKKVKKKICILVFKIL